MATSDGRRTHSAPSRPRPPRPLFRIVRRVERLFGAMLAALEHRDIPMLRPWVRLARSREFWRFVRFLATGGLNFVFYYTLFTALHLFGVKPVPAVVVATVVAVLFNFITTGRLVFGSGRLHLLPRFIAVYVVQLGANIILLRILLRWGIPVLAAEALVIFALAIATFFALRHFVFTPERVAGTIR